MINRVPSLLEQAIKSKSGGTNTEVRSQLEVYSQAQTDSKIAIGLTPYATDMEVATISGGLNQRINQECMLSTGISGATTTVIGYVNITINGKPFKLAVIG